MLLDRSYKRAVDHIPYDFLEVHQQLPHKEEKCLEAHKCPEANTKA